MRRFHFRLAQVLHVRRVQEDQARYALMAANGVATLAARRVEERLDDYARRSLPTGPQSYVDFERSVFLLDSAAGAVTAARAAQAEALEIVAVKRDEWTEARRRVAALERLEERRRAEHAIEVQRAEDRLVDDLVVGRFARGVSA